MDIENEVEKLSEYIEPQTLLDQLKQPLDLIREDPQFFIPSLGLSGDGITLTSVFVVSTNYLLEVRITPKENISFDIVRKNTVFSYRVDTGTQEISKDDKIVASYQTANVEFCHMPDLNFRSYFSYVGSERSEWLKLVYEAFPLDLVLREHVPE